MKMEIMAPAGTYESLMAAIKAGADSVYFGVEQLNMRSRSANFKLGDLKKIAAICHKNNVKSYLTVNTIIYDHDTILMKKICQAAKESGVDAIIAFDMAVLEYVRSIGLNVHCSTQLNISNIEAVRFFSRYSNVIVLARELTLKQIKEICEQIRKQEIRGPNGELVKIEVFCHGALCVAISGKCYMSLATDNASANRGACLQNCRRAYKVIDEETGDELVIDNKYVMSPKDLCTIGMLDRLQDAGVCILKIEGRGRPPEYVYTVTCTYKEAVNSLSEGKYTEKNIKAWTKRLESVYNRGFWQNGYYMGKKLGEWSGVYGSKATKEKHLIGSVRHYYGKPQVAEILLEAGNLSKSEQVLIIGPTTGIVDLNAEEIFLDDKETTEVKKGNVITIKVPNKVREKDKVYVMRKR